MTSRHGLERLHPPPFAPLREPLLAEAGARKSAGDARGATVLRDLVASWWKEQESWASRPREVLAVHHEIHDAHAGWRGHTQLILKDPAGHGPDTRGRLEVVLRESSPIQEATARIRDLKAVLGAPFPRSRAA